MNKLTAFLLPAMALAWPSMILAGGIALKQPDGTELKLEEPAERLVTLSPHLAELVFAAGAGDKLLATVEYSNYPDDAAALPRVGDAFRLDLESIVALKPDLVIAWASGNPEAAIDQIRLLGIPAWAVEIRKPEQIGSVLADIGLATGNKSRANRVAAELERRLEALSRRFESAQPVSYFYQVDPRPLFTINGEHLISQGLSLCGGHNIFAGEPALAFQVAHESVIVADPDALIAPAMPGDSDPLGRWLEWPGMQAVQDGSMFTLNADKISRASPRWLDAIENGCAQLDKIRIPEPSQ